VMVSWEQPSRSYCKKTVECSELWIITTRVVCTACWCSVQNLLHSHHISDWACCRNQIKHVSVMCDHTKVTVCHPLV
jgi:hypothetical protein